MFDSAKVRSGLLALVLAAAAAPAPADDTGYGRGAAPAPLEGAWLVQLTPFNCVTGNPVPNSTFASMLVFGAGGTLQETTSNARFLPGQRSAGFGHWARTGQTTYDAAFQAFVQFTGGNYTRGVQRIEADFEMTGRDALQATATVEFRDEAGTVLLSGCVAVTGSRMP